MAPATRRSTPVAARRRVAVIAFPVGGGAATLSKDEPGVHDDENPDIPKEEKP